MLILTFNGNIKNLDNNEIEAMYLDYFNNYLTIDKFAEHNKLSWHSAKSIITEGKLINNNK
tara:strand:+ start:326 stop:508 length:183 start_codon:yes stop_codon:yes gene_type:complete